MRVLIIGCGYIGLALARELLRLGSQVTGLRRTPGPPAGSEAGGIEGLEWWAADVTRPETLPAITRPFDGVVQCAASGGGGVEDYRRTYLEGTRNALAWLAASPPRKFIYTSSTGVYGQSDGSAVDETSPTEPASPTADILIATEQLLVAAARERGFPAVILRLAGIYGPGRGYWLRQFLAGEARLEGDGQRWLNMIHQEDVVGAVLAALDRGAPGRIYNVTDDEPVTQRTVLEWLARRLNRPLPPTVAAPAGARGNGSTRSRGFTNKRVLNLRARQELRWQPRFPSFREGFTAELARGLK
jgi:nucleoside-diphosphate-sugar epimerase